MNEVWMDLFYVPWIDLANKNYVSSLYRLCYKEKGHPMLEMMVNAVLPHCKLVLIFHVCFAVLAHKTKVFLLSMNRQINLQKTALDLVT